MIYSAIPLAAVGGVLLLYLRDLPFSISAGVGFIALFGIAVLNGIVLIEHFKELKAHGHEDVNARIILGTQQRLRPVILTAAAAALGFLPMAISTSAGAEVQRPLATVVVGGLISATILTLVVLPILYAMFDTKTSLSKGKKIGITALIFLAIPFSGNAQTKPIGIEEAIEMAITNNTGLKASYSRVIQREQLVKSAFDFDKTQLYHLNDQNNIAENGFALNTWGISQSFQFPSIYGAKRKLNQGMVSLSQQQLEIDKRELSKEVSKAYYTVIYWQNVVVNYNYLDSLYQQFSIAAKRRFETGETNNLERLTAESKQRELAMRLNQAKESIIKSKMLLQQWIQSDSTFEVPDQKLKMVAPVAWEESSNPGILLMKMTQSLSVQALDVEQQKLLPDLHFNLFVGSNNEANAKHYSGFQAGIGIPLFFGADKSRINAAKTQIEISEYELENYKSKLLSHVSGLESDLKRYQEAIDYYENSGKELANALLLNGTMAFKNGEIDFLEFTQHLDNAKQIEITYIDNLYQYNLTQLEINFISNQQ
jgi:cobalt-zinc-cadmium resistance protein CzcA